MAERLARRVGTGRVVCECGYSSVGPQSDPIHECSLAPPTTCGPGCQLRRTLSWFVRDDGRCGCTEYAAQMDIWGPRECWRRIEEIVEHLRGAAAAKGLPFIATAARMLVARAIAAAEEEATPPPG